MTNKKIKINRAPVLTLWAAVVAERMGYKKDESLTFGKAVAGLNAQSKGQRLGIYEEKSEEEKEKDKKNEKQVKVEFVELLGRGVPAVKTSKELFNATSLILPSWKKFFSAVQTRLGKIIAMWRVWRHCWQACLLKLRV